MLHTSATSRLLLHKNIHDAVLAKILERAGRVSVGDPLREGGDKRKGDEEGEGATCMGPLVSGPQRDKVLGFISRVRMRLISQEHEGREEREQRGKGERGVRGREGKGRRHKRARHKRQGGADGGQAEREFLDGY